jgi:lipopolysaccharide export system protein LptA
MDKKKNLQFLLFFIILVISIYFFKTYFTDKKKDISKNPILNQNNESTKSTNNLIENIEYISKDKDNNEYIINAEFGELNPNKPELILLKKVTAVINMNKSEPIKIYSKYANYNNINYNTSFFENVLVIFEEHYITSENLDLKYNEGLALISNDVIYKNLNTRLDADKVEFDLITKNSKIFMKNKSDKVKIININ